METAEAFDDLFRDLAPRLWRAIYVYTAGQREIADEAVAEAFARAWQHADSIRAYEPYLYRIAFRIAAAELRRQSRQDSPHEGANRQPEVEMRDLVSALRRLSPKQRAAIVLRYEADLPVAEVARRMGSTTGAVRVHLHMGRKRLRALLGDEEDEP